MNIFSFIITLSFFFAVNAYFSKDYLDVNCTALNLVTEFLIPHDGTCVKESGSYIKLTCTTNQLRKKFYFDSNCQTLAGESVSGKFRFTIILLTLKF